jgi:hypothetical protein
VVLWEALAITVAVTVAITVAIAIAIAVPITIAIPIAVAVAVAISITVSVAVPITVASRPVVSDLAHAVEAAVAIFSGARGENQSESNAGKARPFHRNLLLRPYCVRAVR